MPLYTYRGYSIRPSTTHPHGGYSFAHYDYDGAPYETGGPPADDRCGWAATLEQAQIEIDDLVASGAPDQFSERPLACHRDDIAPKASL